VLSLSDWRDKDNLQAMDPNTLSTEQWAQVGLALKFLWAAFGSAIVAGFSLVTAHAVIPSAVGTSSVSDGWLKVRPLFYLVGIAGLAGLGLFLFLAASETGWIRDLYPRFWQ
jgi:hypothetical protein